MNYEKTSGIFTLPSPTLGIACVDFPQDCFTVFFERIEKNFNSVTTGESDILINKKSTYDAEEYDLTVTESSIKINASTSQGVIMALTTLYLMVNKDGSIPCCKAHDKPRYSHRGLSFDCARQFFSTETVKNVIEQMARVKLNTLHWHLSDDQAWRIESKQFPKLHSLYGDNFYTQDEIKEIVHFAYLRGIEIVPEIDMPGHTTGILSAYPEFSCSGKEVSPAVYGGVYTIVLCAGSEKTYTFINNVLDEVCSLFPSSRFHIGGDEVPKHEWRNCSVCQKKMQEQNLTDEIQLQGYFSNRIIEMFKKHNKHAICWNDSLEAANFDRNATVQYWTVQHEDSMPAFIYNSGKVIYSEMFTFYFDYPHSMTPLRRVYNDPLVILNNECSDLIIGLEAALWAEHIPTAERLGEMIFPRIYAVAERGWSFECNYEDFITRLNTFMENNHVSEVSNTPQSGWDPVGQARQQETLAHMGVMSKAMPPEVRNETMKNVTLNKTFQDKFNQCFFVLEEDAPILMAMSNAQQGG